MNENDGWHDAVWPADYGKQCRVKYHSADSTWSCNDGLGHALFLVGFNFLDEFSPWLVTPFEDEDGDLTTRGAHKVQVRDSITVKVGN